MIAKISPRTTSMVTPASATTPPNLRWRSATLNSALVPAASIDTGMREYARGARRPRRFVPRRVGVVPVLDRARERCGPARDRRAQARRLEPRENGGAASRDRRRTARRGEGLRRRPDRAGARAAARDAAPLRARG